MFHFPSFASPRLCVHQGDIQALPWMGCPIRKSSDHGLFSGSPGLIAANHVLHRLLAPRHPPFALSSLIINHYSIFSCQRTIGSTIRLVEVNGVEPMTSCVQGRRSPTELHPQHFAHFIVRSQSRSHKLYRPPTLNSSLTVVGLDRLELSTSRLSGVRSNHLSYRPSRCYR